MPTGKTRWMLQIYWEGAWRTILDSDERKVLAEYARGCPDDLDLRIINSDEEDEVRKRGRRH